MHSTWLLAGLLLEFAGCSCDPIGCQPSVAVTITPEAWPVGRYTFELTHQGETLRSECVPQSKGMTCDLATVYVTVANDRIESVHISKRVARVDAASVRVVAKRSAETVVDTTRELRIQRNGNDRCGGCDQGSATIE